MATAGGRTVLVVSPREVATCSPRMKQERNWCVVFCEIQPSAHSKLSGRVRLLLAGGERQQLLFLSDPCVQLRVELRPPTRGERAYVCSSAPGIQVDAAVQEVQQASVPAGCVPRPFRSCGGVQALQTRALGAVCEALLRCRCDVQMPLRLIAKHAAADLLGGMLTEFLGDRTALRARQLRAYACAICMHACTPPLDKQLARLVLDLAESAASGVVDAGATADTLAHAAPFLRGAGVAPPPMLCWLDPARATAPCADDDGMHALDVAPPPPEDDADAPRRLQVGVRAELAGARALARSPFLHKLACVVDERAALLSPGDVRRAFLAVGNAEREYLLFAWPGALQRAAGDELAPRAPVAFVAPRCSDASFVCSALAAAAAETLGVSSEAHLGVSARVRQARVVVFVLADEFPHDELLAGVRDCAASRAVQAVVVCGSAVAGDFTPFAVMSEAAAAGSARQAHVDDDGTRAFIGAAARCVTVVHERAAALAIFQTHVEVLSNNQQLGAAHCAVVPACQRVCTAACIDKPRPVPLAAVRTVVRNARRLECRAVVYHHAHTADTCRRAADGDHFRCAFDVLDTVAARPGLYARARLPHIFAESNRCAVSESE